VQPGHRGRPTAPLDERIEAHCHEDLVRAVRQALLRYRPELVQIEHIELAALSGLRMPGQRWVLGLHDAYLPEDFSTPESARRWHDHLLTSYDAVTVCSPEDEALSAHPWTVCVPNGTSFAAVKSSPSSFQMLFMGPFRYAQNLHGIRRFLRTAYPQIKAAVPEASLQVLGGDGAPDAVASDELFAQPGISVLGYRDDVPELLSECALTVNPLSDIRGSSIKVIESLAAGRACVSTEEGARGFSGAAFPGLITVGQVADMAAPVIELLTDSEKRRRIEMPPPSEIERFQWQHCAGIQSALYRTLLEGAHA
jgi:glycosyltransferase involved in cell wall biosynthesis